jgi:hypothetical protein
LKVGREDDIVYEIISRHFRVEEQEVVSRERRWGLRLGLRKRRWGTGEVWFKVMIFVDILRLG